MIGRFVLVPRLRKALWHSKSENKRQIYKDSQGDGTVIYKDLCIGHYVNKLECSHFIRETNRLIWKKQISIMLIIKFHELQCVHSNMETKITN